MAFLGARAMPAVRAQHILRTSRNLCVRASTARKPQDFRGLELLRFDLQRLSQILSGDISALIDTRADFPVYDPVAISDYYDRRPVSAALRLARVAAPFSLWFFNVRYLDRWLSRQDNTIDYRADQLRALLCWAGPTYLKIGQAIGNRPDIVGVAYSNALQKLVDDVGTFDTDVALDIVREELGINAIDEAFVEFDENAVASASLGQVHKARLRSGEAVAVKIQRPSVQRTAALDIYVLRRLAAFAKKRYNLRTNLVGIIDEFAARLWEELDYVREADNCDKFHDLYAEDNNEIYVPGIYRDFSSKRVLTMEWINGTKAPWFPKEDARRLINIGVQCSLRQLLEKGFVHSDPHIGNLLRLDGSGKLVYLDFGMVTIIDLETRNNLIAAIVRLINRDYANLAKDFIKLGFLPKNTDTAPIEPLLEKAFGDASSGGNVTNLSFQKLAKNLSGLAYASPVRIPVYFTLVLRSLTILEGIALQTDASFKIVDESYPFVVTRILTDDSPVLQKALSSVLIDSKTKRIRWSRFKSLLRTSNQSSGLSIHSNDHMPGPGGGQGRRNGSNSTLANVSDEALERVLDFALSDRGAFFRDALELDLTDTVDALQLALGHRLSELSYGLLPPPVDPVDKKRLEAGIAVAEAMRERVPRFFQLKNERDCAYARQRRQKLSEQLHTSSRAVAADITQRNTRRVLRKIVRILLGDRD